MVSSSVGIEGVCYGGPASEVVVYGALLAVAVAEVYSDYTAFGVIGSSAEFGIGFCMSGVTALEPSVDDPWWCGTGVLLPACACVSNE